MKSKHILIEQEKGKRWRYVAKKFSIPFLNIFYHLVVFLFHPKKIEKKYKICICAIFKNEGNYFKEWLEFHRIIGIEHFYLYNNFSDDNYLRVLAPFIENDLVTLIDWPFEQGQMSAYKHWHDNFRNETSWVSFLDLDEFICPYYEKNIYDWVKKFQNYPSVAIYWKMFGTSGIIDPDPKKLVTEQFTISWDRFHFFGKVLFNTCYEIFAYDSNMHHITKSKMKLMYFNLIIPPINEFRYFIISRIHSFGFNKIKDFTIQINHYYSKSYAEFLQKQNKGDVYFAKSPNTYEFFINYELRNNASDYKIFRFLLELKTLLMKEK